MPPRPKASPPTPSPERPLLTAPFPQPDNAATRHDLSPDARSHRTPPIRRELSVAPVRADNRSEAGRRGCTGAGVQPPACPSPRSRAVTRAMAREATPSRPNSINDLVAHRLLGQAQHLGDLCVVAALGHQAEQFAASRPRGHSASTRAAAPPPVLHPMPAETAQAPQGPGASRVRPPARRRSASLVDDAAGPSPPARSMRYPAATAVP